MTIISALLCAAFAADPAIENRPADAVLATQWAAVPDEVREATNRFVEGKRSRAWNFLGKELAAHGDAAVTSLLTILQTDAEPGLLEDSFSVLRKNFPAHVATKEYILTQGLRSPHAGIRQGSLFHVGDQKWAEGREELWNRIKTDPTQRYLAAKSLGELGDVRALPTLFQAVQQGSYFPRHWGNLGLKALTGKSLEDFGYRYGEGAFVSGGKEMMFLNPDPFEAMDYRARRYTACRDYLKWLRDERPELYAALTKKF